MDDILSTDRRIAAGITGYRGNDPDQLHLYSSCSVRSIVRVFFDRFSGENVQFEKAYFTSYKELVSAYFQEGSEEAVQKAMEIAAESGREIEIEDAIKYPSVLLYGEIDAAEYLANRNLSDAPPKPESFLGKGIRFTMGIDWEHIDRNKIYIIYYTDAEKFDGFALLPCRDWYVAY